MHPQRQTPKSLRWIWGTLLHTALHARFQQIELHGSKGPTILWSLRSPCRTVMTPRPSNDGQVQFAVFLPRLTSVDAIEPSYTQVLWAPRCITAGLLSNPTFGLTYATSMLPPLRQSYSHVPAFITRFCDPCPHRIPYPYLGEYNMTVPQPPNDRLYGQWP